MEGQQLVASLVTVALLLPSDLIERLETMVFLKGLMHGLFNLRKSLADQPQPFQLNQPYLGLTHSGSFLGLSNSEYCWISNKQFVASHSLLLVDCLIVLLSASAFRTMHFLLK